MEKANIYQTWEMGVNELVKEMFREDIRSLTHTAGVIDDYDNVDDESVIVIVLMNAMLIVMV